MTRIAGTLVLLALLVASRHAAAQLPHARLSWIYPPGGSAGAEIDVSVGGEDLDDVAQLRFSHPGIRSQPKLEPLFPSSDKMRPVANRFRITISKSVPPGIYDVRTVGRYGVSTPRRFTVTGRTGMVEQGTHATRATAMPLPLNTPLYGRAEGNAVDWYRLHLGKDQRIVIDCMAERIDSAMDATLAVADASGHTLRVERDSDLEDPIVHFVAPREGDYWVEVYDSLYRGGNDYGYRVEARSAPSIDYVFPPAAQPGVPATLTFFGRNLPGSQPAADDRTGDSPSEQLQRAVDVPALPADAIGSCEGRTVRPGSLGIDAFPYTLDTPAGPSNRVWIGYASAPVVVEQEPNDQPDKAQRVTPPCEFAGRFYPARDRDWIVLDARKGESLWIEVISERTGLPTDPWLLIQRVETDKQGHRQVHDLKEVDDAAAMAGGPVFGRASGDPALRFTAPADGTYRIVVRDLNGGSSADPGNVYRLVLRPARPDFRLLAVLESPFDDDPNKPRRWNPVLRQGGTVPLRVAAHRAEGFRGPIELTVDGLPPGVSCPPVTMASDRNEAVLVLHADAHTAAWSGTIGVIGTATVAGKPRTHRAVADELVRDDATPLAVRLADDLTLAVVAERTPVVVRVGQPEIHFDGQITLPFTVEHPGPVKGKWQLKAVGLPKTVDAKPVDIHPETKQGLMTISVKKDAPIGNYPIFLAGKPTIPYRRNPQAAQQAEATTEMLAKMATEMAETSKQSASVEQVAAAQAKQMAKAAADARQRARQMAEKLTAVKTHTRELLEALARAKAIAGAIGDGGEIVATIGEAERQVHEATDRRMQQVAAERAAMETKAQATEQQAAAAEKQRITAEAAAKRAATRAAAVAAAREAEKQRAAKLKEAAKPKDRTLFVASPPVVVAIAKMPVAIHCENVEVAAGEEAAVPVTVERQNGFTGEVAVEIVPPDGDKGWQTARGTVPADQQRIVLRIKTAANAKTGKHDLQLRVRCTTKNRPFELVGSVQVHLHDPKSDPS